MDLAMKKLFNKPYKIDDHPIVKESNYNEPFGTQRLYKFENNYGASVVRFGWRKGIGYASYTSNENEWELAIIRWKGDDFELDYKTEIADDVLGHLTENEVEKVLKDISKL
jgi:hypothetical protein